MCARVSDGHDARAAPVGTDRAVLRLPPSAQLATADSMSMAPNITTTNVRIALSRSD
jgi:hypothetical protein